MRPVLKSILDAARGVCIVSFRERHGRFHFISASCVVTAGLLLRASLDDWCWFSLCIGLVMTAEATNTSIERLSDRVSTDYDDLIRDAKDLAAGAVLISATASATIGVIRFYPLVMRAIVN